MLKRVWLVVISILAFSLLHANGSKESDSSSTKKEKNETEITMWYQENKVMVPAFKKRVEDFNETYKGKYHLTISFIPRGTAYAYEDKVNSAAFTNQLPDLLAMDGPNIANYAANGIILPLDDYITPESKSDLMPSIVIQGTYNHHLYAIGLNESSCALLYNKDIFQANNFRIPKNIDDAYTWEEVYKMAKKISTPNCVGIKLIMNKGEGIPYGLSSFWDMNGASFTSPDGSRCDGFLNSKKGIEAAAYLQRFFLEGLANIDPSPTEFQDGKSAMWIANSGGLKGILKSYPDFPIGVTYYPVTNDRSAASPCGSWALGISKNVKNIEAAKVALEFMTNAESTLAYSTEGGYPPSRRSNYTNNAMWSTMPFKIFSEELFSSAVPRPRTPVYTVLSPKFSETFLDICSGADPKESLDALAKYVDAEYTRFQSANK
ncbi:extracellular solute-binding protein [Treponema sp. HNW]|uniref:extracellular solute-binding protein n=1 Tax=Treponema sp. HNW TaxID=3116654 RepID=UPI003D11F976